jgi:hypothetical protein
MSKLTLLTLQCQTTQYVLQDSEGKTTEYLTGEQLSRLYGGELASVWEEVTFQHRVEQCPVRQQEQVTSNEKAKPQENVVEETIKVVASPASKGTNVPGNSNQPPGNNRKAR